MSTSDTRRPGQTDRPVLRLRTAVRPGQRTGATGDRPAPSGSTAPSPTAPARRCPTPCWRSGRPTPTAPYPAASGSLRRDGWTFTGWGRASTDAEGRYSFTTVEPVADAAGFGAVLRGHGVRPRAAQPAVHARLRAGRSARRRSPSELAARRATRHADRRSATSTACGSTSACRRAKTVRPRRSSCATRAIDRDRPVLARRSPSRRPDERRGVPDGDGRRRKRLADSACRHRHRAPAAARSDLTGAGVGCRCRRDRPARRGGRQPGDRSRRAAAGSHRRRQPPAGCTAV